MSRALPDPIPHRAGRRYLPLVAAFAGAVALHAALAAGIVSVSAEAPRPRSGPDGFNVVSLPGEESAEQTAESES
ncbi:MAG: hypothetical protein ACLFRB_11275, partial [Thiohalorhabdus sp.]|uniref:hypothetical protein n=1 Tax=Thiohalorhabdus sp. TaxID=3094134 RepID=UPI0039810A62